jgi:hypothetical protein
MNMKLHKLAMNHLVQDLKIQKGSVVKVTESCKSLYLGWDAHWATIMDEYIGKVCEVVDMNDETGVYLKLKNNPLADAAGYWFPAFVIEILTPVERVKEFATFNERFDALMDALGLTTLVGSEELIERIQEFVEDEKELSWSDGYATCADEVEGA